MRLFLDEDLAAHVLAQFLRNAGHDVERAVDAGLKGASDVVQWTHAIQQDRVVLTRNYCDFHDLHNLLMEARGHHPGILVVRRDDNTKRNLSPRDIVRAIRNLQAAGQPLPDQCIILNAWQ